MADARLNEAEIACAKRLAELFQKNTTFIDSYVSEDDPETALGLARDNKSRAAILGTMEHIGVIDEVGHSFGFPFHTFQITAKSLQVVRGI